MLLWSAEQPSVCYALPCSGAENFSRDMAYVQAAMRQSVVGIDVVPCCKCAATCGETEAAVSGRLACGAPC